MSASFISRAETSPLAQRHELSLTLRTARQGNNGAQ